MAYQIIGNVFKINATENIPTKTGGTLQRRSLTLIQRRFDSNTGEEFEPNYPTFDFSQKNCALLDQFKIGDRVLVRFDTVGVKYNDKNTGEEKYFNSLRAFRIEPYVQPQQQPIQQTSPQQYPPQGGHQQVQHQQGTYRQAPPPPQQPYYPPPQNNGGLPF